jgi:WD40 repeat protein
MSIRLIKRQWHTAVAAFFLLTMAAPAMPLAQQQPAALDKLPVEVVPQTGHSVSIYSVAFSPDGRLALSGSDALALWDVATGTKLRNFGWNIGTSWSVAFSPNGRFVLSSGENSTLTLFEAETGKELRSFSGHTGQVHSVAFSPDGRFALSGSRDGTLKLWDVATGKELRSFSGHTDWVWSVAFSPDGLFALSGSVDGLLKLWDVATGEELWSFSGHTNSVHAVAFSPDGNFALSGSLDKTVRLWDVATGKELRSFGTHTGMVRSVAFSPDGRFALSGSCGEFDAKVKLLCIKGAAKLWDVTTGQELRSFSKHKGYVSSIAFSPDGRSVLSVGPDNLMALWDVDTGKEQRSFSGHTGPVWSVAPSPDGRFALTGSFDATLKLWQLDTGKELRGFGGHTGPVWSVAFSPDGRFALSGGEDNTLILWEAATGKELRSFRGHTRAVHSVAFSPDGRFALSGSAEATPKLWDVATGKEVRSFSGHAGPVWSVAFSPDGNFALSGGDDKTMKLWEVATGRELRSFNAHTQGVWSVVFSPDGRLALSGSWDGTLKLWEVTTGKELRSLSRHTSTVRSVAFSPDGRFALSGSDDRTMKLWEVATGRELRRFSGETAGILSVAFLPDGRRALSGSRDGTTHLWEVGTGRELARMMAKPEGEWLAMMPSGFFASSNRDTDMLAISRGFEATTIGQVHQSLFNPDLVREALAGDPDGEVQRAAQVINLDKVLEAGPPPNVAVTSHQPGSRSSKDLVTAAAHITDRGKGIGRIEWRINGVTVGVTTAPANHGPEYKLTHELALDPGEDRIEVIAYEKRNLLASLPAQTSIAYDGPADTVKPKLYLLAIGVNKYVDQGSPAGNFGSFPPLGLAVADAVAFGEEMKKAGAGVYSDVIVKLALDNDATLAKLDQLVEEIGSGISSRDTFVIYAAGHGYSKDGRFYMIPQDYQGGADPEALKARAVGQDRLQDWIANRIKAKKALILLDTCQSGAVIGGYTRPRTEAAAAEGAIGRLHEATGRPVLTAAAEAEFAREGYKGHGVFTYALLEALHKGDANDNGKIEVTELAGHVQKRVPQLVAELGKSGGVVKGAAVIAMRGAEGDKQSARFGSTGEDFAVVARLP